MQLGLYCFSVFSLFVAVLCSSKSIGEQFTLAPPYLIGTGNSPGWNMNGHTMVTEKEVRLTSKALKNAIGRIWNRHPFPYLEWEITTKFQITGGRNGGNGFALWLLERPLEGTGNTFGCPSTWKGLMIAADTFDEKKNRINPRIFGFYNDGTRIYNTMTSGEEMALKSCNINYRNLKNPVSLNVAYSMVKKLLTVSLTIEGAVSPCFVVPNIEIPTNYHLGFSASTPNEADEHNIISVLVQYDSSQQQQQQQAQQQKQQQQQQTKQQQQQQTKQAQAQPKQPDQQPTPPPPPVATLPPPTAEVVSEELKTIDAAVEIMKGNVVSAFDTIIASNDKFSQVVGSLATHPPRNYKSELDELTKLLSDLRRVIARIPAAQNAAELEKITATIGEVRSHLDTASGVMRSLNNRLHTHTQNTVYAIRTRSSKGFWTFFVIFEIVFVIGVIFWKQLREEKAKVI